MLMQISTQPITWQQLNAFLACRHGQDNQLGKRGDLSHSVTVVADRRAGLSILETEDQKGENTQRVALLRANVPGWRSEDNGQTGWRGDRKATGTRSLQPRSGEAEDHL